MGARVSVRSMNRWMLLHILQAGKEPLSVRPARAYFSNASKSVSASRSSQAAVPFSMLRCHSRALPAPWPGRRRRGIMATENPDGSGTMTGTTGSFQKQGWLARGGVLLSLLACYGTLAVIGALSALGVTIAVNAHVWAGAIVAFALAAFAGIGLGFRRHRAAGPLAAAGLGAALVAAAMYAAAPIEAATGLSKRVVEIAGFASLIAAALWDWRLAKHR